MKLCHPASPSVELYMLFIDGSLRITRENSGIGLRRPWHIGSHNSAVERTAGSHTLAAAAQRERWTDRNYVRGLRC